MKKCGKCKEVKAESEYYGDASKQSICIKCERSRNEYHRQYKYNRLRKDSNYKLAESIRDRTGKVLYSGLKSGKILEDTGCSGDNIKRGHKRKASSK